MLALYLFACKGYGMEITIFINIIIKSAIIEKINIYFKKRNYML